MPGPHYAKPPDTQTLTPSRDTKRGYMTQASVTSLGFMIKLGQERPTAHHISAISGQPIAAAIVTTGDCVLIGHAHQYRRPPGAL